MKKSRELRFEMDAFFRVVEEECAKVRASELMRKNAQAKDQVQAVVSERFPKALLLADDRDFLDRYPNGVDVVEVRKIVREHLRDLKSSLSSVYRPHITYEILYPITVHTDEMLLSAAGSMASQWELLQSELFDMDFGGDEFYERLEARLSDDETHSFVLEAYYFCMSDHFGGRYRGNEARRQDYMDLLRARIEVASPPLLQEEELELTPIMARKSPVLNYIVATGVLFVVWFGLTLLGASRIISNY